MQAQLLTIKQIESIATRLRKYSLTPADAKALSEALVHAVDSPLPVQAADLATLMRPRRPRAPKDIKAEQRRADMRERLRLALPSGPIPTEILFEYHPEDRDALNSAVQYRARLRGLSYSITKVDDYHSLVTMERTNHPSGS